MQALVRASLVAVALAACHGIEAGAPDAAVQPDGPSQTGLFVPVTTKQPVPGVVHSDIDVSELGLRLDSLRVTGDAAQVASDDVKLRWREGEMPATFVYADAPTGLYSKEYLRVDGDLVEDSYWIYGHVKVDGTTYPFQIEDRGYLDINLYGQAMLVPGGSATITISIDLDHALSSIDFSQLGNDGGTLELDTGDSYMPTFRAKLVESFEVQSSGPN